MRANTLLRTADGNITNHAMRNLSIITAILTTVQPFVYGQPYAIFVNVHDEDGLHALHISGEIDDVLFESLTQLLHDKVDLSVASRDAIYRLPNLNYSDVDSIITYREKFGPIDNVNDLASQRLISPDKIRAISSFLAPHDLPQHQQKKTRSEISIRSQRSTLDTGPPPFALQFRTRILGFFSIAASMINTRHQLGIIRFDPKRHALTARTPKHSVHLPKMYLGWKSKTFSFLLGTYRIGFGQRLTFDTTGQYAPNGFSGDRTILSRSELTRKCKESIGELLVSPCSSSSIYVTPDFNPKTGLRGMAVSLGPFSTGEGHVTGTAFFSYQRHSIYQYALYNPALCLDPQSSDHSCRSPRVFRTKDDPQAPTSTFTFQTLPNLFSEKIGGINISYMRGTRTQVGVTGYSSQIDWLVKDVRLDFQEWATRPGRGGFGAIGVNSQYRLKGTEISAEVTRNIDHTQTGGGLGGIIRAITEWDQNELESSVRYYSRNFSNPYAHPISAQDRYDGLRARDEIGLQARYAGELSDRFFFHGTFDTWHVPSEKVNKFLANVGTQISISPQLRLDMHLRLHDDNLKLGAYNHCQTNANSPSHQCGRRTLGHTLRLRHAHRNRTLFDIQYRHTFQKQNGYEHRIQHDAQVLSSVSSHLRDNLLLRISGRLTYENIFDERRFKKKWRNSVQLTYKMSQSYRFRFRHSFVAYLDNAETSSRRQNPEHWFKAECETHF